MRSIGGLVFAAMAASAAATAAPIHRFSLPGGTPTCGIGIARDKTIVGENPSASGDQSGDDPFVYRQGTFSMPSPSVPAGEVSFTGINASHVIVVDNFITSGPYADTTQSFTYAQGVTTPITFAGATNIQAVGINDAGTIVGSYQTPGGGNYLGFVDRGGRITTLQDGSTSTLPTAIDHNGRIIAGDLLHADGSFTAWLHQSGRFTDIAVPGAAGTFASGVTSAGKVSGTYLTGTTQLISHGFFWQNGVFTTFDVPGATNTQLGGMNEAGVVTGCTTDASGTYTGFFTRP